MKKYGKKGFTLIELIAVLVIMAIIALIVTPLVMSVIRKAKISADKRSVDAYGRSIELAIAGYLMDNGSFPTSIEQLIIEYSGDEVVCTTTNLNSDSSVYLAGCTVGGRSVEGYTYGKEETAPTPTYTAYEVGDTITYNGMNFYVVSPSGTNEDAVTALKAEPLSYEEVTTYGVGHINRYTLDSQGVTYNQNGYGGMTYYSSDTCGRVNGSRVETGCTSDYDDSDIKYAVDAWANDKFNDGVLKTDTLGYKARLLTYEELTTTLGYTPAAQDATYISLNNEDTPSWVYNNSYSYLTMSPYQDEASSVWGINNDGPVTVYIIWSSYDCVVRPVVTFSKSAL